MGVTTTVRMREETREALRKLENLTGERPQDLLARAVEDLRRRVILEQTSEAYARLGGAANLPEIKAWEGTLADGLEDL